MGHSTGNDLESNDILDFSDNCENLDVLMNADQEYWTDRLGNKRPTIDYALRMVGFTPAGFDFTTGGVLKNGDRNKCVFNQADQTWYSWTGDLPYNVIAGSTPGEGWKVPMFNFIPENDIRRYGASLSSIDNAEAITRAQLQHPEGIVIKGGYYRTKNIKISTPVYFETGAGLFIKENETVVITNKIFAGSQQIFQGEGEVVFTNESNGKNGEQSRDVHVSWWGVFPIGWENTVDHSVGINKVFKAVGNTRESIVRFDIGNYNLRSTCFVPRCCWVKGSGTRRTVFIHFTDGFVSFKSAEAGIKISDVQFEIHLETLVTRTSPFISISHLQCEIFDVNLGQTDAGIEISGVNTRIKNISASFGGDKTDGSYLIKISADSADVDGVYTNTSLYGPETLILIEPVNKNISNIRIKNVSSITPACLVKLKASTHSIGRVMISELRYSGTGRKPESLLHLETNDVGSISSVILDKIVANGNTTSVINIFQNSTSGISRVTIGNAVAEGSEGTGLSVIRTNGFVSASISDSVNFNSKTTPITQTGNSIELKISPMSLNNCSAGAVYDTENVQDDRSVFVPYNKAVYGGQLLLSTNIMESGIFVFRNKNPEIVSMFPNANIDISTSELTGTTGSDGKITLSVTETGFYIENRTGQQRRFYLTVLPGL